MKRKPQAPLKTIDEQLQEWIDDPEQPDYLRSYAANLLVAIHANRKREAARQAHLAEPPAA